jgi:signal transduction histidine kinase
VDPRDQSSDASEPPRLDAAHLQLEELVAELGVRTSAALRAAGRFQVLLDAVVAVGTGLGLPEVLRAIVEGACGLVDARYGALGVIGPDRQLSDFVTVGIDDEARERIGPLPRGHGILGLLVSDPRPLMLRDLSEHEDSVGFPPNHPPMRSFLGVPVRSRGSVYGNLYLCEKQGADEFTATDLELVSALAIAAGVAIENSTLYDEQRRREQWIDAIADINRNLLAGEPVEEVLQDIAVRARAIARADGVRVMLGSEDGRLLEIVAAHGEHADEIVGLSVPVEGTAAGQAYLEGVTQTVEDATQDPRVFLPAIAALQPGAVVYVPLRGADRILGVVSVDNTKGGRPFADMDVDVIAGFARQAALAIELARSRRDNDRMRTLEDRERIGRNLHDTVIQRLFAVGMLLQSTIADASSPQSARISKAIDEVDATIKEIRTSIFSLASPPKSGVRVEILDLVHDYAERTGFEPHVVFDGPVDTAISPDVGRHLVACTREAVSNAGRHAQATRVEVSVRVTDELVLRVVDDGIGIAPGQSRRSGVANLESRAAALSGTFELISEPGAGTTVVWRVPMSIDADGTQRNG